MDTIERAIRWFLIGIFFVSLGYTWRMIQTEPSITSEILALREKQREIVKETVDLDVRLTLLEGKKGKR